MKYLFVVILTIASTLSFGQNKLDSNFIFESNLPDELFQYYASTIKMSYSIREDLNPFYLRGDFDGDQKQDYAVSIIENQTRKKGFFIYHSGTQKYFLVGAGNPLRNGNGGDDYNWMDAWKVYSGKTISGGVGETETINLKGEAITVIKTESSSALIYWTGKEYRWYQLGD